MKANQIKILPKPFLPEKKKKKEEGNPSLSPLPLPTSAALGKALVTFQQIAEQHPACILHS